MGSKLRRGRKSRRRSRAAAPFRLRRRPLFELLEARYLLAVVTWDGGGDGAQWTDRFNWGGDQLPGASDNVEIDVAGNPTIELSSGSHSIQSLHSAEAFNFSGGVLDVAATIRVDNTFHL